MDAVYTPPRLAQLLVSASSLKSPRSIADFAAGDGALLRAAAQRWPKAQLFGSDIGKRAINSLHRGIPRCQVALHDFLDDGDDGLLGGRLFDLILLNPPFSNRGGGQFEAEVNGSTYRAGRALTFVARALRFLRPGGEIIAILPASVLTSERDATLLRAIRIQRRVEQIGEVQEAAFKSHAVSVVILKIFSKHVVTTEFNAKPQQAPFRRFAVEISRGSLSVPDFVATKSGPRFIHTTDMKGGALFGPKRRASARKKWVQGPAVLIPRVGRPSKDKIILLPVEKVVLSDCVVALKTVPDGHEQALASMLVKNWDTFKSAYGGSCASYTTLKRLRTALLTLGILSSITGTELVLSGRSRFKKLVVPAYDSGGEKKISFG